MCLPGGKPNYNGAVKIPFYKEQVPLPQGPHAEGWNNQADDERGGALPFLSYYATFSNGTFFQKWLSNLLDFFNPPSVYVKHVCFVNFTQWVQKMPHLAFSASAAVSSLSCVSGCFVFFQTFLNPGKRKIAKAFCINCLSSIFLHSVQCKITHN